MLSVFILIISSFLLNSVSVIGLESYKCGKIDTLQMSRNQSATAIDEFPWTARVAFKDEMKAKILYACSAILISRRHLLTLANCFEYTDMKAFAVLLGDWKFNLDYENDRYTFHADCDDNGKCAPPPRMYAIAEIAMHSQYCFRSKMNDIALITLSDKVALSPYIQPICLPPNRYESQHYSSDKSLYFTGFWNYRHREYFSPEQIFNIKLKTFVQISDMKTCIDTYKVYISEEYLCGTFNIDKSCLRFLAGSPLMNIGGNSFDKYYYLVGLGAYGSTHCTEKLPDIFVSVGPYMDWILLNMNEAEIEWRK